MFILFREISRFLMDTELQIYSRYKYNKSFCKMEKRTNEFEMQEIIEGQAKIKTGGRVFYNVVQEFNRDLSISVIKTFVRKYEQEKLNQKVKNKENTNARDNVEQVIMETTKEVGLKYSDGVTLLEALSATGLRSIRYAKEIPGLKEIIANDISPRAVDDIKNNVINNGVEHLVVPSQHDAGLDNDYQTEE